MDDKNQTKDHTIFLENDSFPVLLGVPSREAKRSLRKAIELIRINPEKS